MTRAGARKIQGRNRNASRFLFEESFLFEDKESVDRIESVLAIADIAIVAGFFQSLVWDQQANSLSHRDRVKVPWHVVPGKANVPGYHQVVPPGPKQNIVSSQNRITRQSQENLESRTHAPNAKPYSLPLLFESGHTQLPVSKNRGSSSLGLGKMRLQFLEVAPDLSADRAERRIAAI
jgi:hypothetical protein